MELKNGMTRTNIAERAGVDVATVTRFIRHEGLETRPAKRDIVARAILAAKQDQLKALRAEVEAALHAADLVATFAIQAVQVCAERAPHLRAELRALLERQRIEVRAMQAAQLAVERRLSQDMEVRADG